MCGRGRFALLAANWLAPYKQLNAKQCTHNCSTDSMKNEEDEIKKVDRLPCSPLQARENVSPGNSLPVMYLDEGTGLLTVSEMTWGLIPQYLKEPSKSDHYRMFNKRIESLLDQPAQYFKSLVAKRRCVVVLDGFYEWKEIAGKKQPYYVYYPGKPMLMAGIYDESYIEVDDYRNHDKDGQSLNGQFGSMESDARPVSWQVLPPHNEMQLLAAARAAADKCADCDRRVLAKTFSIITTAPCAKFSSVHNRQPLFLSEDHVHAWLSGAAADCGVFDAAFDREAAAVSDSINSSGSSIIPTNYVDSQIPINRLVDENGNIITLREKSSNSSSSNKHIVSAPNRSVTALLKQLDALHTDPDLRLNRDITYHPVTPKVTNPRYQESDCSVPRSTGLQQICSFFSPQSAAPAVKPAASVSGVSTATASAGTTIESVIANSSDDVSDLPSSAICAASARMASDSGKRLLGRQKRHDATVESGESGTVVVKEEDREYSLAAKKKKIKSEHGDNTGSDTAQKAASLTVGISFGDLSASTVGRGTRSIYSKSTSTKPTKQSRSRPRQRPTALAGVTQITNFLKLSPENKG